MKKINLREESKKKMTYLQAINFIEEKKKEGLEISTWERMGEGRTLIAYNCNGEVILKASNLRVIAYLESTEAINATKHAQSVVFLVTCLASLLVVGIGLLLI